MTVMGSIDLAVDWQISPKTPILTMDVSAEESFNFDTYGDTQTDMGPVQIAGGYVNVPSVFVQATLVTNFAEFNAAYQAAGPGSVIIIQDGTYDWGANAGGFYNLNRTGTLDDPIFIAAETMHGVSFVGDPFSFQHNAKWNVMAGLVQACQASPGKGFFEILQGAVRITACLLNNPHISSGGGIRVAGNAGNGNIEIDNNEFDGEMENEGSACIKINRRSAPNPPNDYFRIHHNKFHNCPEPTPVTSSREAISMGTGYDADLKYIIENNIFDVWDGEDELASAKSSLGIIRNNLCINNQIGGYVGRGGNRVTYHGNWQEVVRAGPRIAGNKTIYVFNYLSPSPGGSSIVRMAQGVDTESYRAAKDGIYRFNVFSRITNIIWTSNVSGGVQIEGPNGNFIGDNQIHSSFLAQPDDLTPNASYRNDDGEWTEAEWRASNTWGTNDYNIVDLPRVFTIDPSHFIGPGADMVAGVDYDAEDVYGQPSIIKMPSWWK